jgi:hypothetical protein
MSAGPERAPSWRRVLTSPWLRRLGWLLLAAPALYQLVLLATAIHGRLDYPYDLEWMEGGLLHHAERIRDGQGIYVAPSMDFIPYLYTPLYPGLLAGLDSALGVDVGYVPGRVVSVLALVGIGVVTLHSIIGPAQRAARAGQADLRGPALAGAVLALGVFAAAYPYVEGWYDLVRADTLALLMITAGVHAAARWHDRGHLPAVALGVLMALAFFTKQTSILFVAWVGVIIAVLRVMSALRARRLAPLWPGLSYGAAAGVVGLGGAALLDRATGGWFWTYAFEIHQAHDFNMDRFWRSFGNILWHWPTLTILIVVTAVVVGATALRTRRLPAPARPFVLWTATYALSTVVGAIGWGTEFAHFNAYMPALLHGAIAVGAAVPALAACAGAWRDEAWVRAGAAALATAVIGVVLLGATWKPKAFIPTAADRAGGDAVIAAIREVDGEVWVPYHPYYARLAGKRPYVHRMGLRDVTARSKRVVAGQADAARTRRFAAIVFDNRPPFDDLPEFARQYRAERGFVPGRPRVFTGAKVVPEALWVSNAASPLPPGARALFDFERGGWSDWEVRGGAWGRAPASRALPGQTQPRGTDGRSYATSMWGGDKAVGTARSPLFVIDAPTLTMRLGGGTDAELRVELHVNDRVVLTASAPRPASETLREVTWDLTPYLGQTARLVLIDDATGSWGHLTVDEVWLRD